MPTKPAVKKPGKVTKIVKQVSSREPEKVEIAVQGADHLYREIRIENKLHDEKGHTVKLKENADVEVIVEAEPQAVVPEDGKGNAGSGHASSGSQASGQ